ncbi:hypothetical protein V2W45_1257181, partial [Cenococcum geophilum]
SERYSDLKLICQGLEFKVYKVIICTQSSVLEAATNIININEFNSGTVKRIIQFIYKRDYKNGKEK